MYLPDNVKRAIEILQNCNHKAYAVGGCVRDSMLSKTPLDYDICSSASPAQVKEIFKDYHVILTGEKHGTVTVVIEKPLEITTFRTEGDYTDGRHPGFVSFVDDITSDLARRDFTVNAMAYSPNEGLIDPFGGQKDLQKKVICCVGDPCERFNEDALRIMRALRFASVYGFEIEENTSAALHALSHLLVKISPERIMSELTKLLCGQNAPKILRDYYDVIAVFIPEILPAIGFDQRSHHHHLDVYEHILAVLEASPRTPVMRFAALLHDLGKPECFVIDKKGRGHFPHHELAGERIANSVLKRLKSDNETRQAVCALIKNHDLYFYGNISDMQNVLRKLGEKTTLSILEFRIYDSMAQSPDTVKEKVESSKRALDICRYVLDNRLSYSISQLKISGKELMALGVPPSKAMGALLERLLDAVIEGSCENERDALTERAKTLILNGDY